MTQTYEFIVDRPTERFKHMTVVIEADSEARARLSIARVVGPAARVTLAPSAALEPVAV